MKNTIKETIETAIQSLTAQDYPQTLTLLQGALQSLSTPAPVKKSRSPKAIDPMKIGQTLIAKNSKNIPILSRYCVESGFARCTDMETALRFPCALPEGIYLNIGGELVADKEYSELSDFPPLFDEQQENRRIIPAATFQAAELLKELSKAAPFASTDETRYILNGIFLRRKEAGGAVEIVGVDGRRLYCNAIGGGDGEPFAAVLSNVGAGVLIKALTGLGDGAAVSLEIVEILGTDPKGKEFVKQTRLHFRTASGVEILSKSIEGTFPNYEQVIPQMENTDWENIRLPVDPAQWIEGFKGLEAVRKHVKKNDCEFNANSVKLTFTPAGKITAAITSGLVGFEKTEIEFTGPRAGIWKNTPAEGLIICFNLPFLLDILKTGPDSLHLQDELSPGLFTAADGGMSVLMPIRVS